MNGHVVDDRFVEARVVCRGQPNVRGVGSKGFCSRFRFTAKA